jgi:hypothetical protein
MTIYMMKDPTNDEALKLNIWHNNGDVFLGKDTTTAPTGQHGDIICFWEGNGLVIYPMREIKKIEMYFEE